MSEQAINAPVLFQQIDCNSGKQIGIVTLNAEKTLNALTLEMVELMLDQLERWKSDSNIVCLLITAAGHKAFCAGGDVQALYQSATQTPGGPCEHAEAFFTKEYQLDYLLHQFPKPVIVWGHGIVMGGGLGVFAACSHRIVTEKTRLAMPEVSIGLFPDVGGSWFLNKMPDNTGLFLALTGAPINATDSLFVGIADYFITSSLQSEVMGALCDVVWCEDNTQNAALLSELLQTFSSKNSNELPAANVEKNLDTINELCAVDDIFRTVEAISHLESDDRWLCRARDTLMAGSPLSVLIIDQQLKRARQLSLAEVFRTELVLSTNIVRYPEFAEGVRALLIDKDNTPKWQYANVHQVPEKVLAQFFQTPESGAPWPCNPLEHL